ncbi:MAG: hypothetical protein P8L78_15285 [Mariniblastus sp.]|nr:hypothetical protein [Mariniblastus sp.]MDG2183052.1 hypothetical protein [Mariniblastus sp.]
MKSLCKPFVLSLLITAMTLLPMSKAFCQSTPEPAVVVSIKQIDEQISDVKYLMDAAGFGQMMFFVDAMIKPYTSGIDGKKDAGLMLYFTDDSPMPEMVGFLPVTNMDAILDTVSQMAEIDEGDDMTTIIMDSGEEMSVKMDGDYAFFSMNAGMLESTPSVPKDVMKELTENYNIAAKIFAENIPAAMKDQAMGLIRSSAEMTQSQLGDETDLDLQMEQLEMLMTQSESITVGIGIDEDNKKMMMDFGFKGTPNSDLAAKLADSAPKKPSNFTGFVMDGAAMTLNQSGSISGEDAANYTTMLGDLVPSMMEELGYEMDLSDDKLDTIEKAMNTIVEVAEETLQNGVVDMGAVIMMDKEDVNFAMGMQLTNPKKLESAVKALSKMAEEQAPGELDVNLNSGSHKDVTFHTINVDTSTAPDEFQEVVGSSLSMVVGIGKDTAYIGLGTNPESIIKKAMDASAKNDGKGKPQSPAMAMSFNLIPMLEMAARVNDEPMMNELIDTLKESGSSEINMTYVIDDGINFRVEIQEGVFALLGSAGTQLQAQGLGGNEDF